MKYFKWVVGGFFAIPVIFWGVVGALSNIDAFVQWANGESPTQALLATFDPLRLAAVTFALGGLFGLAIGSFGERFRGRTEAAQLADLAEKNRQLSANVEALAQGPVLRIAFDVADRRCNVQKGGSGFINVRVDNVGSHAAQGCAVVLESLSLNSMEQDFPGVSGLPSWSERCSTARLG